MKNFYFFENFCNKEKIDCIHITGGEPTLHPKFDYFVSRLSKIAPLVIYSNLLNPDLLSEVNNYENEISFLVNLNSRKFYTDTQFKTIENNIKKLKNQGIKVAIGHTFDSYPFDLEFKYIINYIQKMGLTHFRISQAMNSADGKNGLNIQQIKELYLYVSKNIDKWKEMGIKAYFDCPVPPCYIGIDVFKYLQKYDALSRSCIPKAFIMWNLDVTHCYSTMNLGKKMSLTQFNNIQEIKQYSKLLLKQKSFEESKSKKYKLECNKCLLYSIDSFCGCPDYS